MIVWPFSTMLNRSSTIKKGFPFIMTRRQPSIYFYDYMLPVAIVRYDTFNRKTAILLAIAKTCSEPIGSI